MSATPQLPSLVGVNGVEPVNLLLKAVRRDLGFIRGVARFPTLLWIDELLWHRESDFTLWMTGAIGCIASVLLIFGPAVLVCVQTSR